MFQAAEERLAALLQTGGRIEGDARSVRVSFTRPKPAPASDSASAHDAITVGAYLFELDRALRLGAVAPAPYEVKLRYLIYVDEDPGTTRDALDVLVRTLSPVEDVDVKLGSEVSEVWAKLQLPLRPGMIAEITARHPRAAPPTGIVRSLGLKLDPRHPSRKVVVRGRVLSQHGTPVSGALVEIAVSDQKTATDGRGNFSFDQAPETVLGETLTVHYENHRVERRIEEGPMALEVQIDKERSDT